MHTTFGTGSRAGSTPPSFFRRRMMSIIVSRTAAAVLLFLSLMPTANASAAEVCPDAFFIGVRGSGDSFEANRGMGRSVEAVYESMVAALPVGTGIEAFGLDYPAVSVRRGLSVPPAMIYRSSVDSGAGRIDREVANLVNRCPVTPIVIAGHSQGAHTIDQFLASKDGAAYPNLIGFALLGDPTRYPARAYNVAPNPPGAGVFYAPGWTFLLKNSVPPPHFWGRIDSYCIPGDPICAGGPQRRFDVGGDARLISMFATSTHSGYAPSGLSQAAGQGLANRLVAAFNTTRPEDGTFGPYIRNVSILATCIAPTPTGRGYWVSTNEGGVMTFGDAGAGGSMSGQTLNAPVVGIAPAPSGKGYWLAAADGGVFAFGDAAFLGSLADQTLNAPVVGIAPTLSGKGYWLAAADGGVFAFGDAVFLGSVSDRSLSASIVGIASTPTGNGYWLTGSDASVFGFGGAPLYEN